ncbi:MAG: hypothetical protein NZM26_00205 [Patescibacteria group bacterium]|nr:hypothetical protein [Patescibacteria group bacterium]
MIAVKMESSLANIQNAVYNFFRIGAIAGFIAAVTILINLNHKGFRYLFRDKATKYWWVFVIACVIPFLVILYMFTIIFGKLSSSVQASLTI